MAAELVLKPCPGNPLYVTVFGTLRIHFLTEPRFSEGFSRNWFGGLAKKCQADFKNYWRGLTVAMRFESLSYTSCLRDVCAGMPQQVCMTAKLSALIFELQHGSTFGKGQVAEVIQWDMGRISGDPA